MHLFWLQQGSAETAPAESGAATAQHAEQAAHHTPIIVEFVNRYLGEPVHHFQMAYTKPLWDKFFDWASPGTGAEDVFGAYTVENAVPWWTVMFILACLISFALIWILKGKYLSSDEPGDGQQVLESSVLAVRSLLEDNVGPHGLKYFPVIATFGMLILVSNLMPLLPGLMPPTAATPVTFALGISSFVYYNYIGIRENGLVGHLKHFAGPIPWLAVLMFPIELISNSVRPLSLGVRLFGNIFGDEQVATNIMNLAPPYTYWVVPAILMPLSVFVAFIQTFIFMLLSMLYIGEVTHGDHGGDHGHEEHAAAAHHEGDSREAGGVVVAGEASP